MPVFERKCGIGRTSLTSRLSSCSVYVGQCEIPGAMKLLVVEDTDSLRKTMSTHLRDAGYSVDATGDGSEGLWYAREFDYAVVVLDLSLPSRDGLDILREIRNAGKQTSVLIATARDTIENRVDGLNAGADDYLVKPFSLAELLARVRANH